MTLAALKGLQTWANVPASGVVDDVTWFVWMAPGSAQQLTLEGACGLLQICPSRDGRGLTAASV